MSISPTANVGSFGGQSIGARPNGTLRLERIDVGVRHLALCLDEGHRPRVSLPRRAIDERRILTVLRRSGPAACSCRSQSRWLCCTERSPQRSSNERRREVQRREARCRTPRSASVAVAIGLPSHSVCKVSRGSTRAARRAGIQLASPAAAPKASVARTYAGGSVVETSNSSVRRNRARPRRTPDQWPSQSR